MRQYLIFLCAAAWLLGGCSNGPYMTEERLNKGLVVILPGIEGESRLNHDIRQGLIDAGVDRAIPIWSWGRPVPLLGVLLNQVDFLGNRLAGAGIADRIRKYQEKYPGRPVHVVGHSGGGAVAVFVAEGMGKGHAVDGVVLLSASISSAYNLTKPLNHSRNGIVSFYSKKDGFLLGLGTIILGTTDGTHGPSAGLIRFDEPGEKARDEKKLAYMKLYQVELRPEMFPYTLSSHRGSTNVGFIAQYVAPLILADVWPEGKVAHYVTSQ